MRCEECGTRIWQAGDIAPAGTYVRVDDRSYRPLVLARVGPLPATFDGHAARYRAAGACCGCLERAGVPVDPAPDIAARPRC
jgi:hypothetical protein